MRIVFAASEISPWASSGGLGDVTASLPAALAARGHEVTVVVPLHRSARRRLEQSGGSERLGPIPVRWASWGMDANLHRLEPSPGVEVIFIEQEHYFDRDGLYANAPGGEDDQLERFAFYARAVVAVCERLGRPVDVLHAHDWHAALLPVYLHAGLRDHPLFASCGSVFTVHNLHYQGRAPIHRFGLLGLPDWYASPFGLEYYGEVNPMKGGIVFADQVTTVSPNYAREIQTPQHGAGLDGLLRLNAFKLHGIVNGIDVEAWDPLTDDALTAHFDAETLAGRQRARRDLRREAALNYRPKSFVAGLVSRLVGQKGIDLVLAAAPEMLEAGIQLVVLGSGEPHFESAFRELAEGWRGELQYWSEYDPARARRVYAGSDVILVPSHYEPCGLTQMYASHYGALPVVRETGGLADTVIPFGGRNSDEATGFSFRNPSAEELLLVTRLASLHARDAATWKALQRNGMMKDFSWNEPAGEYELVYEAARSRWMSP